MHRLVNHCHKIAENCNNLQTILAGLVKLLMDRKSFTQNLKMVSSRFLLISPLSQVFLSYRNGRALIRLVSVQFLKKNSEKSCQAQWHHILIVEQMECEIVLKILCFLSIYLVLGVPSYHVSATWQLNRLINLNPLLQI